MLAISERCSRCGGLMVVEDEHDHACIVCGARLYGRIMDAVAAAATVERVKGSRGPRHNGARV
jgi:hypothetical protein